MSTLSDPLPTSKRSLQDLTESQQAAIDALYAGNTLLVAPKGFGKAVVGQTAAQELIKAGELNRVLVLAPLRVCQLTWGQEWTQWEHLEAPGLALGDEAARRAAIEGTAAIVVLNFDNLVWLWDTYGHRHGFDGLLVDESTKLKAAGGGGFKALRKMLKHFSWRCAMTADPVAEMGVDIYSQVMIVDNGAAFGRNKDAFRRRYFYPTDFQQRKWAVLPGADKKLRDVLAGTLVVVTDHAYEAALSELRDVVVRVEMPSEAWGLYNELEDRGFLDLGAGVVADTAALLQGKRQQLTAGALYDVDGVAHWVHDAKLEALERLLDVRRGPVVVCYAFQFELDALRERWPDVVTLGTDAVSVEAAWSAGAIRLLAVHPSSCSHGLNLQYGGHELIVLSAPWGADPWEQLVGRLRRRGQRSAWVRRTTLVVGDTVDQEILARHKLKKYASGSLNDVLADR